MAVYNVGQLHNFLRQAGWDESLIKIMGAIGMAESSGNSKAVNRKGEYSVGLWQININPKLKRPWTEAQLIDPLFNAQVALKIYKQQGLRAWGAYTDGRYKKYLASSEAAYKKGSVTPIVDPNVIPIPSVSNSTWLYAGAAGLILILLID